MKGWISLISFLVVTFLVGLFLTGCYTCCPTCPPVTQSCTLKITAGYWVWGTVYINDQSTGQYIDFETKPSTTISNVPCNQMIKIYLIDPCGAISRTEYFYTTPGINYLYFTDWYGTGAKGDRNLEGKSSRECHDCF